MRWSIEEFKQHLAQMPVSVPAAQLNARIEACITAGEYCEALTFAQPGGAGMNALLIQINLAEAEYNLGEWKAAWERLRPLDRAAARYPITRTGLLLQRAWIAAHFPERAEEALQLWSDADVGDLPAPYCAEYFFTHAAALLALQRLDEAHLASETGAEFAIRVSSARNALFLLARVAAARGDWARAESLCREAAAHAYRGQGGDGLLLWGDALAALGRRVEARAAWKLAIDRDPESESAGMARKRV